MMALPLVWFVASSLNFVIPQAQAAPSSPANEPKEELLDRTESDWRLREMELMTRIRSLELELAQEQSLRLEREREWFEFTKLLALLPEARRPELPTFLQSGATSTASVIEPDPEEQQEVQARERAQAIKTSLRAYLRAEGVHALDLLEVGLVQDGAIGPIVARQLDNQGRFLCTLVADRLRLEKSQTGFHVTLVLERGYERRAGQIWPFPSANSGGEPSPVPLTGDVETADMRHGILRIPLVGVQPDPWIEAFPELFQPADREHRIHDGETNLIGMRYSLNQLLDQRRAGARWKLVSIGGVLGKEWRDVHMAELALDGRVVRRLFADRVNLRLEGDAAIFEMQDGAQERGGRRAPFLAGRYTLVLPGIDTAAWLALNLPGLAPGQ